MYNEHVLVCHFIEINYFRFDFQQASGVVQAEIAIVQAELAVQADTIRTGVVL